MMRTELIYYAILIVFISSNAIAASFDCSKSATDMEISICSNNNLNSKDTELGKVYWSARKKLSNIKSNNLKQDQLRWLKKRNATCSSDDIKCLISMYENRIEYLKGLSNNSKSNSTHSQNYKRKITQEILLSSPPEYLSFCQVTYGSYQCGDIVHVQMKGEKLFYVTRFVYTVERLLKPSSSSYEDYYYYIQGKKFSLKFSDSPSIAYESDDFKYVKLGETTVAGNHSDIVVKIPKNSTAATIAIKSRLRGDALETLREAIPTF